MYKLFQFIVRFGVNDLRRKGSKTLLLGVPLSLLAMFGTFIVGINMGVYEQMIRAIYNNFVGSCVVYHDSTKSNDILWPDELTGFFPGEVVQNAKQKGMNARLQYRSKAFSYSGDNQAPVLLMGVDEAYGTHIDIVQGETIFNDAGGANRILITRDTSDKLGVSVGDNIAVEVVTADGFRNFDYFMVSGIYKILGVPQLMTNHIAYTNLLSMQMLKNDYDSVTEILLQPANEAEGAFQKERYEKLLPPQSEITLQSGKEYAGIILAVAYMNIVTVWILWGVIFLIMSIFLYDFIVSSVRDQLRELVIMFSMGVSKLNLIGIVLGEITLLCVVFIVSGVVLGTFGTFALSFSGIEIPVEAMKPILGGHDRLYPSVSPGLTSLYGLGMYFAVVMIAFSTLRKIWKMEPVEILRNEE